MISNHEDTTMKRYALSLLLLLPLSALAAYDVTATMQATVADATHDASTACHLYLNGTLVGTGVAADKPCGSPVLFPALFPSDGTYLLTSKSVSAAGEAVAFSPTTTVVTTTAKKPNSQTVAPAVTVACSVLPCAPSVSIVVTP